MLKQLLLLFGLLAVVHCAQKQYAYAYGNPSRSGLQCKDATMIFIELYRTSDWYTFNAVASTGTTNLVGGIWDLENVAGQSPDSSKMVVDIIVKNMAATNGYVKTHYIDMSKMSIQPESTMFYLKMMIIRGVQHGLEMGIYTSTHDWISKTGNSTDLPVKVPLWWVNDGGVNGNDTPDDFDDFVPFGPFDRSNLVMKQFSRKTQYCGSAKSVYFV